MSQPSALSRISSYSWPLLCHSSGVKLRKGGSAKRYSLSIASKSRMMALICERFIQKASLSARSVNRSSAFFFQCAGPSAASAAGRRSVQRFLCRPVPTRQKRFLSEKPSSKTIRKTRIVFIVACELSLCQMHSPALSLCPGLFHHFSHFLKLLLFVLYKKNLLVLCSCCVLLTSNTQSVKMRFSNRRSAAPRNILEKENTFPRYCGKRYRQDL